MLLLRRRRTTAPKKGAPCVPNLGIASLPADATWGSGTIPHSAVKPALLRQTNYLAVRAQIGKGGLEESSAYGEGRRASPRWLPPGTSREHSHPCCPACDPHRGRHRRQPIRRSCVRGGSAPRCSRRPRPAPIEAGGARENPVWSERPCRPRAKAGPGLLLSASMRSGQFRRGSQRIRHVPWWGARLRLGQRP